MKRTKLALLCLTAALILLLFPACGAQEDSDKPQKPTETLIPISLNGTEIRVGETTVQTLLDQGLNVSWVDDNYQTVVVDPSRVLEANTYYTGGNVNVSDHVFANISLVTDAEKPTPLGQAVIARLEFDLVGEDDQSVLSQIVVDGVPVTEFTRAKAGEMYPDWRGNDTMWLKYGLQYKYDLNFNQTTGLLTKFTVECQYDVDWNS